MISPALMASNLASSATIMVSGIATSRMTGAVGFENPCSVGREEALTRRPGLRRRAAAPPATCNSLRP